MARKVSVDKALGEGEQILRVWEDNPEFTLGNITLAKFKTQVLDLRTKRDQVETTRTQLTGQVNEQNEQASAVAGVITRARSGFRAVYGPDSTQYEQAGGTRQSERKRPAARKSKKGSSGSS